MSHTAEVSRRRRPVVVAVVGTVVVVAYALLAAVQILVLNPLAAVPGAELSQIYADVSAAGESMGAPLVLAGLAVGPVVAVGLLLRTRRRPDGEARIVAVQYLALVALGAFGYFWASFGPGMALADTYGISGGDHATDSLGRPVSCDHRMRLQRRVEPVHDPQTGTWIASCCATRSGSGRRRSGPRRRRSCRRGGARR